VSKVIVQSRFLGSRRRVVGRFVEINSTMTAVKVAVPSLPYNVWVAAKDVKFI
jgi:hypothetical protein